MGVALCCSVLQCAAVCCSVLRCAAVCCSVLQCVAVCCSVLQCDAVCCSAVCCSMLQCVAVCRSMLLCVARLPQGFAIHSSLYFHESTSHPSSFTLMGSHYREPYKWRIGGMQIDENCQTRPRPVTVGTPCNNGHWHNHCGVVVHEKRKCQGMSADR